MGGKINGGTGRDRICESERKRRSQLFLSDGNADLLTDIGFSVCIPFRLVRTLREQQQVVNVNVKSMRFALNTVRLSGFPLNDISALLTSTAC